MPERLKNQRIVVSGGGRGIGVEIAKRLAGEGGSVLIADIDETVARETAEAIENSGGMASPCKVDVRDRGSVTAMIGAAVDTFGGLDSIFNNAGIAQVRQFLEITEEDWHTVMDVNGLGVLICMQEAVKQMLKQDSGGSIINMASIAGKQGYEPIAHYRATKFGVVALTQAAARAFGEHKIRVNAICAGVVATETWKLIDKGFRDSGLTTRENEAFENFANTALLGRASQPDDMAGVAAFLASSGSAFMTGQTLLVDGGIVLD